MPSSPRVRFAVAAALMTAGAIGSGFVSAPATIAEAAPPSQSDRDGGDAKQNSWRYPNSETPYHARGHSSSVRPDGTVESKQRGDTAEYTTDAPFHQVVRFYVERVGFEPPNWSILGREFPGDAPNMPAMWTNFGEDKSVSIHHHIRPKGAVAGFLVSDANGGETTSVTISRDLDDEKTYIAVLRHIREAPPRGDVLNIKK